MEIGTFNKKTISQGEVKNINVAQLDEVQKRANTGFVNTVSKSKSVTLDLSQFLDDYNSPVINNQQVNDNATIETLFDDVNQSNLYK